MYRTITQYRLEQLDRLKFIIKPRLQGNGQSANSWSESGPLEEDAHRDEEVLREEIAHDVDGRLAAARREGRGVGVTRCKSDEGEPGGLACDVRSAAAVRRGAAWRGWRARLVRDGIHEERAERKAEREEQPADEEGERVRGRAAPRPPHVLRPEMGRVSQPSDGRVQRVEALRGADEDLRT